jgi:excisionase family DNA binding protein
LTTSSSTRRITAGEAGLLLGLTTVSVARLVREGTLKAYHMGRVYGFDVEDVQALRAQRARRPAVRRGRPTLLERIERESQVVTA